MPQPLFPRLNPRITLAEQVYRQLSTDIIRGRFAPGAFLSTGKVAKAMGISPMPVRAAMTRLETEGLVEIVPQRGVRVMGVSVQELQELFIIRSRLEALAAHLACPRLTDVELRKLKRLQLEMAEHERRRDVKHWLVTHEQWHQLIFRASGNRYLTRLLLEIWHRGIFRRFATRNVPGHMDRRLQEHRALLAALESRDAALAERLWRDHILVSGEEIIRYLETAQVPGATGPGIIGGLDGFHNARRGPAVAANRARLRREGGRAARRAD